MKKQVVSILNQSLNFSSKDGNCELRTANCELRIVLVMMAIDEAQPQMFEELTAAAPDWVAWLG